MILEVILPCRRSTAMSDVFFDGGSISDVFSAGEAPLPVEKVRQSVIVVLTCPAVQLSEPSCWNLRGDPIGRNFTGVRRDLKFATHRMRGLCHYCTTKTICLCQYCTSRGFFDGKECFSGSKNIRNRSAVEKYIGHSRAAPVRSRNLTSRILVF